MESIAERQEARARKSSERAPTKSASAQGPRVLLVPDSLYWAAAEIAREIAANNPGYRFETQSEPVLTSLLNRFDDYPDYFDVVHFLLPHAASRLAHFFETRTAVVVTLHHIESERCTEYLPESDGVMVCTTQWRDELSKLGVRDELIVQVPYGVDAKLFQPAARDERRRVRRELGLPGDAFVVGYSAKRSERKGIEVLLEGLVQLSSRLPGLVCLLMGPGWSGVDQEVIAAGVRCVRFPFAVDKRRLAAAYRSLDVLWVTSRIEGGPLPVLEAMATAVPCISTPVGIPLDVIVDGENGFLVAFDKAEAFCARSLRLAHDPTLYARLAAAARRTVLHGWQWSQTVPRASDLYERAITRFRARSPRGEAPLTGSRSAEQLPAGLRRWIAGQEHLQYSRLLLNRREYDSAAELALRALRADPRDPRLWAYASRTRLELLLRNLRANPRDLKLWLHLRRKRGRQSAR